MQLREHPSLMGRWPPNPGGVFTKSQFAPPDCLDVLVEAHFLDELESGLPGIALKTTHHDKHFVRKFFIYDKDFAKALCKFLKDHTGATIQAIGDIDVTFESVTYAIAGVSLRSKGGNHEPT